MKEEAKKMIKAHVKFVNTFLAQEQDDSDFEEVMTFVNMTSAAINLIEKQATLIDDMANDLKEVKEQLYIMESKKKKKKNKK